VAAAIHSVASHRVVGFFGLVRQGDLDGLAVAVSEHRHDGRALGGVMISEMLEKASTREGRPIL
jgi:hypothetical protein